jgi:beta-mannanase
MPKRQLFLISLIAILPLVGLWLHGRQAFSVITQGGSFTLWRVCAVIPLACGGEISASTVALGAYDYKHEYDGALAIEHWFIRWNTYDRAAFKKELQRASEKKRWPLITIEPWPDEQTEAGTSKLFPEIVAGKYDPAIKNVCTDIGEFGKPVFVRWGHEMEYVSGRYPWAQTDHDGYVSAYRYFVDSCRSMAKNIFYVWSPAGNQELRDYWPGQQYADYVGVSVYAFPEWDLAHYRKVRSFDEIFVEKYGRVAGFNKPIMIAELGVTGTQEHQFSWLDEAMRNFARYPLLKSVVYFNAIDSRSAWPDPFPVPNWYLDLTIFPAT